MIDTVQLNMLKNMPVFTYYNAPHPKNEYCEV